MAVTKKVRFEVFKRDKFTCQYCGRQAPDVVLQCDHIHPRAKGGTDDILNLVTSCVDCNQGKKHRTLSDDAAVKQRKKQLDLLQQKREQLEMLMNWQRGMLDLEEQAVVGISELWSQMATGYQLTETGMANLKAWVVKYGTAEVIEVMKISAVQYIRPDRKDPTKADKAGVEKAFSYIPRICRCRKSTQDSPYIKDLLYIRGIIRNRCRCYRQWEVLPLLERACLEGITIEHLKSLALKHDDWYDLKQELERELEG
jgi:hypothetical protein